MTTTIGTLKAVLTADSTKLQSELKSARQKFKEFADVVGAVGLSAFTAQIIHTSDSLNEFRSDIGKAFGGSSQEISDFIKSSVDSLGIAESEFSKAALKIGGVFNAAGFGEQAAADMSKTFLQLAADISAAKDGLSIEDAMSKLQAGLRGSGRGLTELGIAVSEETLQQEALAQGINKTTKDLTDQEKVLVAYQAILRQSAKYTGEAKSELETFGGAVGRVKANAEQLSAALGDQLRPAAVKIADAISTTVRFIQAMPGPLKAAAAYSAALSAALLGLSSAMTVLGVSAKATVAVWAVGVVGAFSAAYVAAAKIISLVTKKDYVSVIGAIGSAMQDVADGAVTLGQTITNFFRGFFYGLAKMAAVIPGIGLIAKDLMTRMDAASNSDSDEAGDKRVVDGAGAKKNRDTAKQRAIDNAAAAEAAKKEAAAEAKKAAALDAATKAMENQKQAVIDLAKAQSDLRGQASIALAKQAGGKEIGDIESAYQETLAKIKEIKELTKTAGAGANISEEDKQRIAIQLEVKLQEIIAGAGGAKDLAAVINAADAAYKAATGGTVDLSQSLASLGTRTEDFTDALDPDMAQKAAESAAALEAANYNAAQSQSIYAQAVEKAQAAAEAMAQTMSDAAMSIGNTIAGLFAQSSKGPLTSLQAGSIGSAAGGAAGAAAGVAIGLPPQLGGQIGSALGNIVGSAAEASGALRDLTSGFSRAIGAIQRGVGAIVGALGPIISAAAVNFSTMIGIVADVLVSIAPILSSLSKAIMPIMGILTAAVFPILKSLAPLISALITAIEPLMPVFIALAAPLLGIVLLLEEFGVVTAVVNFAAKGLASGLSFLSAGFQFAAFGINKAMEFLLKGIGNFVKSIPGMEDLGQSIINQGRAFDKAAGEAWDAAMESVKRGAELAGEAIGRSADEEGGLSGKEKIRAAKQRMRDEARAALREELRDKQREQINNALADSGENAANSLDKLSESIGNATSDFKAAAYRFGAADSLSGGMNTTTRSGQLPAGAVGELDGSLIGARVGTINIYAANLDEFENELRERLARDNFISKGTTAQNGSRYVGRGEST